MKTLNWFEVDKEGLKQLQAGKPKSYLLRELIQNAWDENVKVVKVNLSFNKGITQIEISDDSKEGFRDLKDSYTLFKETYKRKDPEKRGRFNIGEKQVFSICERAEIITTKGTIIFDKKGRQEISKKISEGTIILISVKMTKEEYQEILENLSLYLHPQHISFYINREKMLYIKPHKTFKTKLTTEIADENNIIRKVTRETKVELYKMNKDNYLYEMGIPVTKIDCEFSINILQKIPLSIDRENVSQAYLQDLFAEVLNNIYQELSKENISTSWIREGMSDERISKEAVEEVINKRYGDNVVVADPFDKNSIDEAISHGYRVIYGNEMSKEEWNNVKSFDIVQSSSSLFGTRIEGASLITPNKEQELVAEYSKRIAKRLLNINLKVNFIKERAMITAQFESLSDTLTFNIAKLGNGFFEITVAPQTTDLILHELGHHAGNHTESGYHELITKMAGELVDIALKEPEFFKIK